MADETNSKEPPHLTMLRMMTAQWVSQAITVAARLNVADLLSTGPKSADELAEEIGCHATSLYRLLRGLAGVGVLLEDSDQKFSLTETGQFLRRDVERSLWATAIMMGVEHYQAWGNLIESVRDGRVAFEHTFDVPVFEYYEQHPDSAKIFHQAMSELTSQAEKAVVEAFDFSRFETVVDVGGGKATLLSAILRANPALNGIVFDQPSVVGAATETIDQQGLADRAEAIGGDFFAAIPAGGDCYVMASVIHDWNDEDSIKILRNIRQVMPVHGHVVLAERVLKPAGEEDFAKMSDLNMLVMTGGMERTADEYGKLFSQAGLELVGVTPTKSALSLVDARAV